MMPGSPRRLWTFVLSTVVVLPGCASVRAHDAPSAGEPAGHGPEASLARGAQDLMDGLALSFEANVGQHDPEVRYLARVHGATAFFTDRGPVWSLLPETPTVGPPASPGAALGMELRGGETVRPEGRDRLPGTVNYFLGQDPEGWHPGAPTFGHIVYTEVYPGIDLRFRSGTGGVLQYDFVLAAGVDPGAISVAFPGSDRLTIDRNGDLVISTPAGEVVHRAPTIYQPSSGVRLPVEGRFALRGRRVGFDVSGYDRSLPVVIDPPTDLTYSTYLGGAGTEIGHSVAVQAGVAYVIGQVGSATFPTTTGAYDTTHNGSNDVFVAKVIPAGAGAADLAYSTYLGGAGFDQPQSIAVDGSGNVYLTGAAAAGFPTTVGAFDTTLSAPDAFVAKIVPAGGGATDLAYSTFLGGLGSDFGIDIAVDGSGNAYVTGQTGDATTDLPTTPGAYDESHNLMDDAFLAKINPAGNGAADLVYSTFLGGDAGDNGGGVAVDSVGNVYLTGGTLDHVTSDFPTTTGAFDTSQNGDQDAFVAKLNPGGNMGADLLYSTLLGDVGGDHGTEIALDGGAAFVIGNTSAGFPTTSGAFDEDNSGAQDAFVAKVVPAGNGASDLAYSTFLGGGADDYGEGIAASGGAAVVTGWTEDDVTNFPTTPGAYDETHDGDNEGYVAMILPASGGASDLAYSTFLGGAGQDRTLGIAAAGSTAFVTGFTTDDTTEFPATPGAFDTTLDGADAFVATLVLPVPPGPGPGPPPAPAPAAPTAKRVDLTASKGKVKKGRKATFTAVVTPCAGHEGDLVEFERNGANVASVASDVSCTAELTAKIRRKATWQARSPQQDADHTEGLSSPVTVKVKKPKKD